MNYFEFLPDDQPRNNWLANTALKEPPWVALKPRYASCICPKCEMIKYDDAFGEGFDDSVKIRVKGDIFESTDGFICVNEKVKGLIESEGMCGVALKPIAKASWWVVNITSRVNGDRRAYTRRNTCDLCERARQTYGKICCINQIEVPEQSGTFFSTIFDRGGSVDRDMFVTEDIVASFKEHGIKGGVFSRLLTPLEYEAVKAARAEMDPLRWPKDSKIVL